MQHNTWIKHLQDVLLTITVGIAVLFFWRGAWTLFDQYLLPNDTAASAWYSLLAGTLVAVVAMMLQLYLVPEVKIKRWKGFIVLRMVILLYAVAGVAFWRGVWYLQDEYLLTDNPEASSWTSVAIGAGVLLCMNSLRSVVAAPFFTAQDGNEAMSWEVTTFYRAQGLESQHLTNYGGKDSSDFEDDTMPTTGATTQRTAI
eukprot:TRINITY_DN4513_c0_g1_i1.p1 TRINITY_DN4513_c0_g1~~TRINITY_DN4513_c0_g1_i1.p1  ORF type:complete len:200 (+),score=15.97 TRINITY_DN4513_c0_g1_i1:58-657(+)